MSVENYGDHDPDAEFREKETRLFATHPDLQEVIKRMQDPTVSDEEFLQIAADFNERQSNEKEGLGDSLTYPPVAAGNRSLRVKWYSNGVVTISAGI